MGADFRRICRAALSSVGGMEIDLVSNTRVAVLRTPVVLFMAVAAALGTATMYPLQPAIADVAGSLRTSVALVGTALACGPIGYLVGLALLVPLVDQFAPRTVVSAQFGALAVALAGNAVVGSAWLLGPVIGVIGAGSAVGAQLSSVAGRFAAAQRRATVLGIVTAGISAPGCSPPRWPIRARCWISNRMRPRGSTVPIWSSTSSAAASGRPSGPPPSAGSAGPRPLRSPPRRPCWPPPRPRGTAI
ncbi:hypothetical protein [Nocardia sp. CC201C]|uniref:hypothetical protein n=2 Tax=Nocardia TaxID=1817 RepID=UPI0024A96E42|nr:hypothetical protein [Nocardia sp. CC201C]